MGRSSTPNNYNFVQNKENSDDNAICTSIKMLENLYNVETESSNFGGTDSYHDIRRDFNNNGVERDLNETLLVEQNRTDEDVSMNISPTSSSASPQAAATRTLQKKFVMFGGVLRKIKKDIKGQELCVFCKNNGQPDYVYETHRTQDEYGRVVCPHLRIYTCPICKTTGDDAHTIKYCPQKPILTVEDTRITSRKMTSGYRMSSSAAIAIPHRRTNATYTRQNFQNYRF